MGFYRQQKIITERTKTKDLSLWFWGCISTKECRLDQFNELILVNFIEASLLLSLASSLFKDLL